MSRESMNLTEEQWEEIQKRKGGDAQRLYVKGAGIAEGLTSVDVPTVTRALVSAPAKSKAGAMNRWETEYSYELEARRIAGEISWWGFEAVKLKLTGRTFYTPDFTILIHKPERIITGYFMVPRLYFCEIKGYLRDDANVKFKVAAELFPWAEFFMYRKQKGGGWELMKHLNGNK